MNLQNVPMNMRNFITARTKQRNHFCGMKKITIFKQEVPTGRHHIRGVLKFSTFLSDL
jgi:hypothetical protein